MTQLSSPISEIKPGYDVIVVGSGYGGSITASRMARAGKKVCLLEKGKEFEMGDFPDTEEEALSQIQVDLPSKHIGNPNALYDFRINKDMNVLQGCGLGGTSLINANVSLEPEEKIFDDSSWPEDLKKDFPLLKECFRQARTMLKPLPYPENLPTPAKLQNMEISARGMGLEESFYRPPINVNFKEGINHVGVYQKACTGCGDCVTGCNQNAKNTTTMNYLPDAKNHGAEIFTQTSVKWIEKADKKWIVHYQLLGSGRESFGKETLSAQADVVVLSAGTLGTTEILFRSASKGLVLSEKLGKHFTGNGDFLAFGYNGDTRANAVGSGTKSPDPSDPIGPCITGIIDLRQQTPLDEGMVIEEGVAPGAFANRLPFTLASASNNIRRIVRLHVKDYLQEKLREVESITLGPYKGAVNNTMTYLVMTHDNTAGKLRLEKDRIRIDWPGIGKLPIFKKVQTRVREAIAQLGGNFVPSPTWNKIMGHDLITVHPLGGCIMAETAEKGVVNHKGQVFAGSTGTAVHEGLYICDGSIIPRSLGVNPLLTISALSERNCYHLAKDRGWHFKYNFPPTIMKTTKDKKTGIQFTEKMGGYVAPVTAEHDFTQAYQEGKRLANFFEFTLTIIVDDLDEMLSGEGHEAGIVGTVQAPLLSSSPITVSQGVFNLLEKDTARVNARTMQYRMKLITKEGKSYHFYGVKHVHNSPGFDLWKDTTSLFVTIYEGENEQTSVVAKGILKIAPEDFKTQLTTIKVLHTESIKEKLKAQFKFGKFFAGSLYDVYGGVMGKASPFNPEAEPRKKRPLRVNTPQVFHFTTQDQVQLRFTRYQGGNKGPVMLCHGLGVSSLIFSIDTIDTNLLEYLFEFGYDVWLLDYRASIDLPASESLFTADEVARYDYPKAVEEIFKHTGADSIQVVAHCYGATTFSMAMLAGLKGVRSAVMSQIGPHVSASLPSRIKSGLYLPNLLKGFGLKSMEVYTDTNADWKNKLYNQLLRLYPVNAEDRTTDAVSNRITFIYGQLYELDNLNQATFNALHEMFGVVNIDALKSLALMVRKRKVIGANGEDVYLPNIGKNMKIPIAFIHGDENACFLPKSTDVTYNLLKKLYPGIPFKRHLIPNYGHIDCIFGKNASKDVYPFILNHLEATLEPIPPPAVEVM